MSSTRLPDTPIRSPQPPAKVTVITSEDIKKTGAKTVQEAVHGRSTLECTIRSAMPSSRVSICAGSTVNRCPRPWSSWTAQRINEPDFNVVNFDLIPVESIERIILPGNAAIYGKNALGGVINIITKRGAEKRQRGVAGRTTFGSFNRQRYNRRPVGRSEVRLLCYVQPGDGRRISGPIRCQDFPPLREDRVSTDGEYRPRPLLYVCAAVICCKPVRCR
ncbi:MAG: hypothetical protein U0361_00425 [Nitrospiraceae bacterium]